QHRVRRGGRPALARPQGRRDRPAAERGNRGARDRGLRAAAAARGLSLRALAAAGVDQRADALAGGPGGGARRAQGGAAVTVLQRVTRRYVQHLHAPPERVMPLLTAARENEWAASFQPRILHAGEPPGGVRGVFQTGEGAEETLWTMTACDAATG